MKGFLLVACATALVAASAAPQKPDGYWTKFPLNGKGADFALESRGPESFVIRGTRTNYAVHLGSGVVHQKGGAMLNILPVHSQHRGKLFLPFLDDDPQTAEILTKVLFLAQDQRIQDPNILAQIR